MSSSPIKASVLKTASHSKYSSAAVVVYALLTQSIAASQRQGSASGEAVQVEQLMAVSMWYTCLRVSSHKSVQLTVQCQKVRGGHPEKSTKNGLGMGLLMQGSCGELQQHCTVKHGMTTSKTASPTH